MRKRQINRTTDKYDFWSTIKSIQTEYRGSESDTGFTDWLANKYGIQLDVIDGMYGSEYTIVDEAKHTFYKLKYG